MDDPYTWAKLNGVYMEQSELVSLMRDERTRCATLVVDVRDDDRAGGHVAGSLHAADSTFDAAAVHAAVCDANATTVVFHCMESVRRGPRCAQRLASHVDEAGGAYQSCSANAVEIRVLKGGADQWIRRFHKDSSLVADFDNEFWGFYPLDGEGDDGGGDGASGQHILYERPADQIHPQPEA